MQKLENLKQLEMVEKIHNLGTLSTRLESDHIQKI